MLCEFYQTTDARTQAIRLVLHDSKKIKIKWQFHSIQYRLLSDLSSTIRLISAIIIYYLEHCWHSAACYLNALGNRAVKVCNQLKET